MWTLNNVKYIPALKRNLIFIEQVNDQRHYTTFGDRYWKVMKDNIVVVRVKKE